VFLGGKGMLDSILVANETVDYLKKEKLGGMFVKVDFEKALGGLEIPVLYDGEIGIQLQVDKMDQSLYGIGHSIDIGE